MDELFRFTSVRPAQTTVTKTISISGNTPFQDHVRSRMDPKLSPEGKWTFVRSVAEEWVSRSDFKIVTDASSLSFNDEYKTLRTAYFALPTTLTNITCEIGRVSKSAEELETTSAFQSDRATVWDSILLIFLIPSLHRHSITPICEIAQVMDIVRRIANHDPSFTAPAALQHALKATILLPQDILPAVPSHHGHIGIADLLVVKHHISGYEGGEIVSIKNVATQSEASERFAFKREAEKIIKSDISSKAGNGDIARYGAIIFSSETRFDSSNSKTDSQLIASDYAKDVTSRAVSKMIREVRFQQTSGNVESFEEDKADGLKTTTGIDHLSGMHQSVNKVYTAQIFNYGKRMVLDIMIPEPAALLLDLAKTQSQSNTTVVAPPDFDAKPSDLTWEDPEEPHYYGRYLTQYDVAEVTAPLLKNTSLVKTFILNKGSKFVNKGAVLEVPEGFEATSVHVNGSYNYTKASDNGLNICVADTKFSWNNQGLENYRMKRDYWPIHKPCVDTVAVSIEAWNASDYAYQVQIQCEPTKSTMNQWRLETHTKIHQAWQQKVREYHEAVSAAEKNSQLNTSSLGSTNPPTNRLTELIELKRGAITLLATQDLQQAEYARFFEQSFEWDQMTYTFHPYYYSPPSTWSSKALLTHSDPLFAEFLKASQARVVVPVRPTMEAGVLYFLTTGQVWMGGDAPLSITSGEYLSVVEEIKEGKGAVGGEEVEYGGEWEVVVPTSIVKVRKGGEIGGIMTPESGSEEGGD